MEAVSVTEFRKNLAAYFDKADEGEKVLIRRKNKIYALVSVGKDDLMITPELRKRIDEARQDFMEGRCVTCRTKEELEAYLESL